jgi:hypothetical protein
MLKRRADEQLDGRQYSHDEEGVQRPAVEWLVAKKGYHELVSDIGASGDRFDTIEIIGGRLHLLEVKATATPSMVFFDPAKTGSIEAKIPAALAQLRGGIPHPKWDSIRCEWMACGCEPPKVVVLAAKFATGAADTLTAMLRARSSELGFDWALWRWNSTAVEEITSGVAAGLSSGAPLLIRQLVGSTRRMPSRSLVELQALADNLGIGPLFAFTMTEAKRRGLRQQLNTSKNLLARSSGS